MADFSTKLLEVLIKLNTSEYPDEWVRAVLDQDFTECEDLPIALDDEIQHFGYFFEQFVTLKKELKPWVDGNQGSDGQGLWTVLVENSLSHKRILCLLHYIMTVGQKRLANIKQKLGGLAAADVYFTMITIPGSGAFKIFHPMLFQRASDSFKMWKTVGTPKRKRNSSPLRQSQSSQRSKSRKRQRNSEPDQQDEDSDDYDEETTMTPQEMNKINNALFKLLKSFVNLLKSYPLREAEDSAYQSLQILADLSKLEAETFDGEFDDTVEIELMRTVPEVAFRGLSYISTNAHGDVTTMTNNVLKHLLPGILMYIGENKAVAAATIPRPIVLIKDNAVAYICYLLKTRPENAGSVRILLQHMCTKVVDKADYRAKVAQAVVIILKQLPTEGYARMIEWFYKFGRHNKIAYRGFALDLAGMLIQEQERTDVGNNELSAFLTHGFLLQMILSRCSDVAPTVRARAISCFSNCASSAQPNVVKAVQSIMTPMVGGYISRPTVTRIRVSGDGLPSTGNHLEQSPVPSINSTGSGHADTIASARPSMESAVDLPRERQSIESALANLHSEQSSTGQPSPLVTVQLTPGVEITLTDGQGVVSMLRRRAKDEKVNVRKASLMALENLVRLDKQAINNKDLEIITERCRDPALSVRKQAMQCLTELLMDMPRNTKIQRCFLEGVLPLVIDRETTAQEKAMDVCGGVILGNIVQFNKCTDDDHKMIWELLDHIAGNDGVELRRYLAKACQHWGKSGQFKKNLITSLKTHVGTPHNNGVWMLLSEVAAFIDDIDADFVLDYWNESAKYAPASEFSTVQRVLIVLEHVAKNINEQQISGVTADLKQRLMKFDLPSEIISAAVTTLNKLCRALTGDKETADKMAKEWFVDLLKACDSYLSEVILGENQAATAIDEDTIICYLYTLGEIAQLCPDKTPKRVFMLVQSLIASPVITSIDGSSQPMVSTQLDNSDKGSDPLTSGDKGSDPLTSDVSNIPQVTSQSQPGSQFTSLSQGSVPASQPLSQFRGSKMSPRIRAHAFVTLGKLCLQNEDIAKKCVAAMARELEICEDPAVRNNVVVIMCDLCVRYTTLVDRYLNNISSCLKDDSVLVRKQTLTLLTHLLQEDFLKWKGSLFFRFVTTLVDDNKDIQNFSEFCLVHLLMQRHPGMFFHNFVESVFHFNNYDQHKVYNQFSQTDREKKMFSLKGQQNKEKRRKIYQFLLDHMTDEHKFQLTAKLSGDILGAVVDDALPMDIDTSALLQDTLNILASKEIKLSSLKTRSQEEIETEQEMAQAVMNAAKKTLISQVMKRNVIENIVPTVIALKHRLEQHRSPVLKDLMIYLRELMKDYKNEVKDFLAADRQLANEIEFDLRKFEEERQKEEEKKLEEQKRAAGTPKNVTPSGSPSLPQAPNGMLSPRTPPISGSANKTPGAGVRTPGGGVRTRGGLNSPGTRTPTRNVSMAAIAMLNSARKAMQQAKQITENRSKTPQRGSGTAGSSPRAAAGSPESVSSPHAPKTGKKVAFSQSTDDRDITIVESKDEESFKTPVRSQRRPAGVSHTRAVSTPTNHPVNLTFQLGDHNLSMIPMSPIPTSIPMRLYGETNTQGGQTPSWSTKEVEDPSTGRTECRDILHMFSPDKPAPRPRVFNVKSPAPFIKEKENNPPGKRRSNENPSGKADEKLATKSKNTEKTTKDVNISVENGTTTRRSSLRNKTNNARRSLSVDTEDDSLVMEMVEAVKATTTNRRGSRKNTQLDNSDKSLLENTNNDALKKSKRPSVSRKGSLRGQGTDAAEGVNSSTSRRRSQRSSRT